MRKLLAITLASLIILSLSSCNSNEDEYRLTTQAITTKPDTEITIQEIITELPEDQDSPSGFCGWNWNSNIYDIQSYYDSIGRDNYYMDMDNTLFVKASNMETIYGYEFSISFIYNPNNMTLKKGKYFIYTGHDYGFETLEIAKADLESKYGEFTSAYFDNCSDFKAGISAYIRGEKVTLGYFWDLPDQTINLYIDDSNVKIFYQMKETSQEVSNSIL